MKVTFKSIRERMRMTQIEMAIKAGVSLSTIQSFESGSISPSFATRRKLSEAYGVKVEKIESACGVRQPQHSS